VRLGADVEWRKSIGTPVAVEIGETLPHPRARFRALEEFYESAVRERIGT